MISFLLVILKSNLIIKFINYLKYNVNLKLSKLEKNDCEKTTQLLNNNFYDYTRWHLISIVSLMCNKELKLGKFACLKAIEFANNPVDLQNINLFDSTL